MNTELGPARQAVLKARRVVVLSGAGISAESGIPTFRGEQGLWKTYRPEDLATPEAFAANPELVWEWYQWRHSVVAPCVPNPGHAALVELEQQAAEFTLATQNIDGLHTKAGSQNVLELHGSLWKVRCARDCGVLRDYDGNLKCDCGAWLRPHIVWFGEPLDHGTIGDAYAASKRCDLFLCVGTSGLVFPANQLPLAALQAGATVIEVNLERTSLSSVAHFFLAGKAGEVLPRLIAKDPPP